MRLIDPTIPAKEGQSIRAPALGSLEGRTIGLLWNHKHNGDRLLTETAARLQARFGGQILPLASKNNASAPAPAELLTDLSPECDYLITAAGD